MKLDLRFLSSLSLVAALGFGTGCPADDDPEPADTDSGSSSSTDPSTGGPTTDPSTGGPTTDPTDPSGSGSVTTDPTDPSGSDSGTTDPTGDPLPNGSNCTSDAECESGACSSVAEGLVPGVCGECTSDDACDFGCTPSIPELPPIFPTAMPSTCNDGTYGNACEDASSCSDDGAFCVEIINALEGVVTLSACSSCESTADCDGEQVCNVAIDVATISGTWSCVDAGSIADGETCDLNGDGTAACMGACGSVLVADLIEVGVCGECATDEDCMDGTCQGGEFADDGTVTPSSCIPN